MQKGQSFCIPLYAEVDEDDLATQALQECMDGAIWLVGGAQSTDCSEQSPINVKPCRSSNLGVLEKRTLRLQAAALVPVRSMRW